MPCDEQGGGERLRGEGRGVRGEWKVEFVETEEPDVGAHPFFVGAAGKRQILEDLPGGAAVGGEPIGFLAGGEEFFKGFGREAGLFSTWWALRCVFSKKAHGL